MATQNDSQYLCPECAEAGTPVGVRAAEDITLHLRCPGCGHFWTITHHFTGGRFKPNHSHRVVGDPTQTRPPIPH